MSKFTDLQKIETIEHFIEQWRPGGRTIEGERETYLILKEIADEIRGRDPRRATETSLKLERAIGNARKNKIEGGYSPGNLREIAEIVLGRWTTIREALDKYARKETEIAKIEPIEHPSRPYTAITERDYLRSRLAKEGAGSIVSTLMTYAMVQPSEGSYSGSLWAIAEWIKTHLSSSESKL